MNFLKTKKNIKDRNLQSKFLSLKTKNHQLLTSSGFTLIETMVAISIMLMAITSPILLAKQGMVSARQARNSITAFYMAQDAIEYIRNVRDSNLLNGDPWLSYLSDCIDSLNGDNFCKVNTLELDFNQAFDACTGNCPEINKVVDLNKNFVVYDYNTSYSSSGFTRNVKIVRNISDLDEVNVEVKIIWSNGNGRTGSFEVSEILKKLN